MSPMPRLKQGKLAYFSFIDGQWFAFAHVEPVEEEGQRRQHKAGISQGDCLHEAGDVWDEQDAERARVEVGTEVGGQEGERSPARQSEAVQRAVAGEQKHEPGGL